MSELQSESTQLNVDPPQNRRNVIAVTAIIAAAIVAVACIISATVVLYAFFQNAPW